ncbi:DUF4124 domain-containing protein [Fulvimonas yonginensis]|uniref:DUF4124 domain-containing protein n=1 Tax=Fulvimonas yonginensis TaxID=1495200 RepID=A0ABU8JAL3_9GAMM
MRRLSLALLSLLLASPVVAQVYKWTDTHGTVHYSESPPPQGTPYKRITMAGTEQPGGTAADAQPSPAPQAKPAAGEGTMPNTPENLAKFCSAQKANLDLLKGKEGVVLEQDGKSVPLDETQRNQQIALAEQQYRQFCSH